MYLCGSLWVTITTTIQRNQHYYNQKKILVALGGAGCIALLLWVWKMKKRALEKINRIENM